MARTSESRLEDIKTAFNNGLCTYVCPLAPLLKCCGWKSVECEETARERIPSITCKKKMHCFNKGASVLILLHHAYVHAVCVRVMYVFSVVVIIDYV